MYHQQGDVLLHRIDTVPPDATKVETSDHHIVLAEGEATGHAHVIADVAECELYTLADALFVKCRVPITVTHEEHKPVTVGPGIWRISIVREYDHFREEAQRVVD